MNAEKRNCQNCKSSFEVAPEDFAFYEKITVPPPNFCPDCRMQRRMAWRNERNLYRRKCDLCQKAVISSYHSKTPFPVYCADCWWGDKWDAQEFAKNYGPQKPFLAQWKELQDAVPRPYVNNMAGSRMINSDYTNCAGEMKNCYLVYGALRDEDCAYSHYINDSKDCFDTLYCIKCESCYECLDIENCYNLAYCISCLSCHDSMFLFDCRNCANCIGCSGLRSKEYHIFNKPYSKEEYEKKKTELKLNTREGIKEFSKQWRDTIYYTTPRKYYHGQLNENFSGDYIANVENTYQSFYIKQSHNCKYVFWCNKAEDVYDYMSWGDMQLSYECISNGDNSYKCLFTETSWSNNQELEYCGLCFSSSNLFGCIGLRNKKYCILNKQYSEKEYAALREQIISDMKTNPYRDKQGMEYPYGEFLPTELSPFLYANTAAHEHFPLPKEEIMKRGYNWQEPEKSTHQVSLPAKDLLDSIDQVKDDVLNQVIGCEHGGQCQDRCTEAFKITAAELAFYRKKGIPLPSLCYNCRHAQRVAMRNPLKLWPRTCTCQGNGSGTYKNIAKHFHGEGACPNKFETAYAPERPEIVYCEECYNAEVV